MGQGGTGEKKVPFGGVKKAPRDDSRVMDRAGR